MPARRKQKKNERPHTTNRYHTNVLSGNWFEDRYGDVRDMQAIVPGICGRSEYSMGASLYTDSYKSPPRDARAATKDFLFWKSIGFENRIKSKHPSVKLFDGQEFLENVTTTKDVMFQLRPLAERDVHWTPFLPNEQKFDMLNSYGNATETGLLSYQKCNDLRLKMKPLYRSTYQDEYIPKLALIDRDPCSRNPKRD